MDNTQSEKIQFENYLKAFVAGLQKHISDDDGQWTIKGFIDVYKNVYSISSDTKILSKILEIHIFPSVMQFAQMYGYKVVLADHQNYYPDISFVKIADESIKFAVDFKTTYRNPKKPHLCNGFTLGSHGKYFVDRQSRKNIQFPYASYTGHFCLGIIYDRLKNDDLDDTRIYDVEKLSAITSVIANFQFFVAEKWKIASDRRGSGNTANIGSINSIRDIISGQGMFSKLGEMWFDDYWMNYKKIVVPETMKTVSTLREFVEYKRGDLAMIVDKDNRFYADGDM
jgi:hypothetical protein